MTRGELLDLLCNLIKPVLLEQGPGQFADAVGAVSIRTGGLQDVAFTQQVPPYQIALRTDVHYTRADGSTALLDLIFEFRIVRVMRFMGERNTSGEPVHTPVFRARLMGCFPYALLPLNLRKGTAQNGLRHLINAPHRQALQAPPIRRSESLRALDQQEKTALS